MRYRIIVFVLKCLLPLCRKECGSNPPKNIMADAMGDAGYYKPVPGAPAVEPEHEYW